MNPDTRGQDPAQCWHCRCCWCWKAFSGVLQKEPSSQGLLGASPGSSALLSLSINSESVSMTWGISGCGPVGELARNCLAGLQSVCVLTSLGLRERPCELVFQMVGMTLPTSKPPAEPGPHSPLRPVPSIADRSCLEEEDFLFLATPPGQG